MTSRYLSVTGSNPSLPSQFSEQVERLRGVAAPVLPRARGPGAAEGGEGGGGRHGGVLHVAQAGSVLVGGRAQLGQGRVGGERAGGVGGVAGHVEGAGVGWPVHGLASSHPLLVQSSPVAVPPHPLPSLEVPALEHVIVPVGCNRPGVSTEVNRMLTKR